MKTLRRLFTLLVVFALIGTTISPEVSFAAKKKKKVNTVLDKNKAKTVKLNKKYTVKNKDWYSITNGEQDSGFVKFKAPKDGTYTFFVSNLKQLTGIDDNYICMCSVGYNYWDATAKQYRDVEFPAGDDLTSTAVHMCDARSFIDIQADGGGFLTESSTDITLSKGATVYIKFHNGRTVSYDLKVTKSK